MPSNKAVKATTKLTKLDLTHTPNLMSKYMQIIDEEAERILAIPIKGRSTTDIRTSVACLTALNAINKDLHTEYREMRKEIKDLPTNQLNKYNSTIPIIAQTSDQAEANPIIDQTSETDEQLEVNRLAGDQTSDEQASEEANGQQDHKLLDHAARPNSISEWVIPPIHIPYSSTNDTNISTNDINDNKNDINDNKTQAEPTPKAPFDPFGRLNRKITHGNADLSDNYYGKRGSYPK